MNTNEVTVLNPEDAPGKGRPTMCRTEFAQIAYRLALLGNTNKEIAEMLGVSLSTFNKWKNDFSEFSDSVTVGKEIADGDAKQTEE